MTPRAEGLPGNVIRRVPIPSMLVSMIREHVHEHVEVLLRIYALPGGDEDNRFGVIEDSLRED